MHILAFLAYFSRGLINFNFSKISSVLENCSRILISISCMYDYMKSKEKYIVQIHILV